MCWWPEKRKTKKLWPSWFRLSPTHTLHHEKVRPHRRALAWEFKLPSKPRATGSPRSKEAAAPLVVQRLASLMIHVLLTCKMIGPTWLPTYGFVQTLWTFASYCCCLVWLSLLRLSPTRRPVPREGGVTSQVTRPCNGTMTIVPLSRRVGGFNSEPPKFGSRLPQPCHPLFALTQERGLLGTPESNTLP